MDHEDRGAAGTKPRQVLHVFGAAGRRCVREKTDAVFDLAGSWALKHGFVQPGQRLVVTAGVPINQPGMTNLIKIIEIK